MSDHGPPGWAVGLDVLTTQSASQDHAFKSAHASSLPCTQVCPCLKQAQALGSCLQATPLRTLTLCPGAAEVDDLGAAIHLSALVACWRQAQAHVAAAEGVAAGGAAGVRTVVGAIVGVGGACRQGGQRTQSVREGGGVCGQAAGGSRLGRCGCTQALTAGVDRRAGQRLCRPDDSACCRSGSAWHAWSREPGVVVLTHEHGQGQDQAVGSLHGEGALLACWAGGRVWVVGGGGGVLADG